MGKAMWKDDDWDDLEQYLLLRSEVEEIVNKTISEARSSWGYGEGMDMGVLWLRIDRDILQFNKVELTYE